MHPFELAQITLIIAQESRLFQIREKISSKTLPARGIRKRGRRESLTAFDFRPQNLLEKMLFRVVVSRKKRQAPLVNYYISPKAKTNSSSGMTHFTSGQCHGKNGQKNLC